jgi:hypothetical protein
MRRRIERGFAFLPWSRRRRGSRLRQVRAGSGVTIKFLRQAALVAWASIALWLGSDAGVSIAAFLLALYGGCCCSGSGWCASSGG